jgi:hypothetical protein
MTNNDNLNIQDLVATYKDYLGEQAQEIVVLKTLVATLQKELLKIYEENPKIQSKSVEK